MYDKFVDKMKLSKAMYLTTNLDFTCAIACILVRPMRDAFLFKLR